MAFAARHADTTIAKLRTIDAAKAFRGKMTDLTQAIGRDPKSIKILFSTSIILGDTMEEAREKHARLAAQQKDMIETKLAGMGYLSMVDFSKYDLDEPLPAITTNASRMSFESYLHGEGSKTLRDMLLDPGSGGLDFIGTADSIAAQMAEAMDEIGGDGFLFQDALTRRKIVEVTDGLVPALKRRGLTRPEYQYETIRENLLSF
jgi:long-chain alkane monooxygenase